MASRIREKSPTFAPVPEVPGRLQEVSLPPPSPVAARAGAAAPGGEPDAASTGNEAESGAAGRSAGFGESERAGAVPVRFSGSVAVGEEGAGAGGARAGGPSEGVAPTAASGRRTRASSDPVEVGGPSPEGSARVRSITGG